MKILSFVGKFLLVPLSMFVLVSGAFAAELEGKVDRISTHSDMWQDTNLVGQYGLLFIWMSELSTTGCNSLKRFAVPTNHPSYEAIQAIAMDAYKRQLDVTVNYGGCTYRGNSRDLRIIRSFDQD